MKSSKIPCLLSLNVLLLIVSITTSYSQLPGTGSTLGIPGVDSDNDADYTLHARAIWTNIDGSVNEHENIYFVVVPPGAGNRRGSSDWYTNPTAWLSYNEFHLNKTALQMHDNIIFFNTSSANRKIVLWSNANNDHQFNGFGINSGVLRYQVNNSEDSHVFYSAVNASSSKELFRIQGNGMVKMDGQLSIGNSIHNPPTSLPGDIDLSGYKVFVNGGLLAKEIRVKAGWADYVFDKNYPLDDLAKVEAYINKNGRLKGMPSAEEVKNSGIELGDIARLQQEKIEELTLYIIQLKKEIELIKNK